MHVSQARSYRCYYCPLSKLGIPIQADSGVLPFVQLRAANAEITQRHAATAPAPAIAGEGVAA